jgi:putative chitinase
MNTSSPFPTFDTVEAMAGKSLNHSNATSFLDAIEEHGQVYGLNKPHRFAHLVAQLLHESSGFQYDRELWGPTSAQSRYDGRTDLGNYVPGDGFLFRGRTLMQITGRYNYRSFSKWVRKLFSDSPDFEVEPDAVLSDPWEGLAPIWYWDTRDLNRLADQGNIELITRRINGGLNGYADRLRYYDRAALVLLEYDPEDILGFQRDQGLVDDGISGPMTRGALHKRLKALPPFGASGGKTAALFSVFALLRQLLKGLKNGN